MMTCPKLRAIVGLVIAFLLVPSPAQPQASGAASLDQVLRQMETVGKSFRSFTAAFAQKHYTALLKEFDQPESGLFYYARAADGSALLRQEFTTPSSRILTIKGGVATLYQPALKEAQIFNLGKNKNKAEYLAIGIGQSPSKLQETFDIQYQGTENVEGAPCSVLVLKPKSARTAAMFSAITLWVKKSSGVPIQDKLLEPGGDYTLITFSKEQLNTKIPDVKFEQKLPPGVAKQVIG